MKDGKNARKARAPARPGMAEPEHAAAVRGHEPTHEEASTGGIEDASAPSPPGASVSEAEVDYKDRWLRAEAELQNVRRRAQRDGEEAVRFAEDQMLLETISQLDDLERALEVAREAGAPDSWVQGVQLVANRMADALTRRGVTPIPALGEPFDPELHEAMLEVDPPDGASPGEVVQVVRKGYRRGARALRAARVVVAKRAAGSD